MIKDIFAAQIGKSLTPASFKTLEQYMIHYVDKNSDILMTLDLSKRFSFADVDRAPVYTAIGVTEDELVTQLRASKYIYNANKKHSNPFYAACMLAMNRLLEMKKPKEAEMIMVYVSLMMYTSIHKGLFKYNANQQVMDYTLAHLDSSFIIKSMSSLYAFLQDNASTAFTTYKSRIVRCNDTDISYVMDALHTRIKGKMKKIASAYYANHESGNYLNQDTDNITGEGDYHEMDNDSYVIDRMANKMYIKLLNHQFNERFLKYAITRSDVSFQKLKNLIDDIIQDDENNVVKSFIVAVLEYYLLMSGNGPEYISRGEFISYMKTAYASNTEMQQMVFIKTTLDNWLTENMVSVGRANYGKTAKLGYKKALYMFFIFFINYEAKVV